SSPSAKILLSGSVTATSALGVGTSITQTIIAAANNDVLVGLDINPTFTNGAFTGVRNYDLRLKNNLYGKGAGTSDRAFQILLEKPSGIIPYAFLDAYADAGTQYFGIGGLPGQSNYAPNYIYFLTASTLTSAGTRAMAILPSGNINIGSGVTDAGYKLDVNGTIRTTGASTNGVAFYDGTYGAKVWSNGYVFTIEREGAYGPTTYLFKYADGTSAISLNGTTILGLGGSDDGVMMSRNVYARHNAAFGFVTYGGTTQYKAIQALYTDNNTSGVAFNYKTGGTDTEAMRITSAGYIGVGTTSPLFKVDISNRVMLGQYPASATYGAVYLGNITPSNTNYTLTSNSVDTYLNGTSSINFSINDVIKAKIASTGNFLIGTTT
ncbi:hypothetical protein EB001_27135, partial [bacterium]|nr:hypothetical protein [bacterium]